MPEPVLALSITTPQSWAKRHTVKHRRPKRNVLHPNQLKFKIQGSKQQLLQMALAKQSPIRKSPTNGLQLDPFQTYPIPTTTCVANMAQYFMQVWGPQHGRAFAFDGYPNPYLSLLWPFALQSDLYFEGLIALCRATSLASQGRSAREDNAFAFHRGNVMTKLRARLQNPQECADDTTILTVATLGTIDYILGDHTAATAHVSGMRQMIKIRGVINPTTPWERLLQANVAAYESLWSFLFAADSMSDDTPRQSGQLVQNAELPIYMTHPFKPEVCEMLSKLPQGFCDIGLTGVLSLQMIRLLSELTSLIARFSVPFMEEHVEMTSRPKMQTTLEDLHRLSTLQTTQTERFLSHGLVAFCYLLRFIHFQDKLTGFYETALKALTTVALRQTPTHRAPDRRCHLWANMMIATALQNGQHPPPAWKSVMQQFLDKYYEARQWKKLEKELKTFFWGEKVSELCKEAYDEAVKRNEKPEATEERPSHHSTMAIRNVIL
ncbi:uncharacterized protein Z518_03067 [Rhinocladiella mackenziei CBS 650.93]|uniref:Rhinocladiella mackenziei CBS 650.93 unplaced genomic scaffold supercont1.2, whole genome shotgun sequence n=1 Tax=Rhinocladiella mackenziei CBS 650.93 TaxID=1442369 RepID=A0A0D2IYF4_9EURO|nr:uncharacterized protein Z518_03067 [Rhinocladiella mackenziei CBS 650.93]KIX08411.1 hypothetical protein Z518_03067 [Rhinocladiella mackenziei CBS 650.93]